MALISMRQMLDHAAEFGYGVPAFNVNNLEQMRAIMEAADKTDSPVIVQASAGARKYAGAPFLRHLILPAIVLGTIPLAVIARQTRSAMLEVMGEDYVRTAKAKGLSEGRVVGVHALRNAMIPVITTIGLQIGVLLAGAILTETIFSWPGIGKWMIDSISRRDYPVVQSGLLLIAAVVMIVNLIVDLTYGLINPRIRHQ